MIARLLLLVGLLAGCQSEPRAAAPAPGLIEETLVHEGLTRRYQLRLPPHGGEGRRPLLIALHGGLGQGASFARLSGLASLPETADWVLVFPDGRQRSWNAGGCCGPAMRAGVDDVGFLSALVETLVARHRVDPGRVHGTGFSNGAMLLQRAACERPGLFRAIAPVAGGLMLPACAAREGPAVFLLQGREDARIPWEGGVFEGSPRPSMQAMARLWGERNRCDLGAPVTVHSPAPAGCQRWSGCADGRPVQWCGLAGVGHQWPGGQTVLPQRLGPNTASYSASREILAFFQGLAP
ncbi:MAG TPA: PHB depolymerase family esterase [Nevskiaceae bacterium]|nr:PHB depolymerase family esterase [Nevskiaceae bacterium]